MIDLHQIPQCPSSKHVYVGRGSYTSYEIGTSETTPVATYYSALCLMDKWS